MGANPVILYLANHADLENHHWNLESYGSFSERVYFMNMLRDNAVTIIFAFKIVYSETDDE